MDMIENLRDMDASFVVPLVLYLLSIILRVCIELEESGEYTLFSLEQVIEDTDTMLLIHFDKVT